MKVLVLSPYTDNRLEPIKTVIGPKNEVSVSPLDLNGPTNDDIVVLYGYRKILPKGVIVYYENRIYNLHISYLPYNRGASPNLWSWYENSPKGVSIHQVDAGIDTGPLVARRQVILSNEETLETSYNKLHEAMGRLFTDYWPTIRNNNWVRTPAEKRSGSYHTIEQSKQLMFEHNWTWNTPCWEVESAGREAIRGVSARRG